MDICGDTLARKGKERKVSELRCRCKRCFRGQVLVAAAIAQANHQDSSFHAEFIDRRRDLAVYPGHLAVFRGVSLTDEDILRREVITQLICNFVLSMPEIEKQFGINFHEHFSQELEELKVMQQDGLLELSDKTITVTPAGKLLIRNICMVFDAYLRAQKEQRFSRVI